MNVKYIRNQESADIFLYGEIGNIIDGNLIAQQIRSLDSFGVKIINEYINSEGGSIINGLSIIAANIRAAADIHTFNDGVAASMAGIIYLSGKKKFMLDYARLMLHEPNFWGQSIDDIEEPEKIALINFRDMLVQLTMKSLNKTKEEIEGMLKAETWYNAEEAQNMGLVDKILTVDFSKQLKNLTPTQIYAKIAAKYEIDKAKNELINIKMEKLAKLLNVANVEDEMTSKVQTMFAEIATLKTSITEKDKLLQERGDANALLVTEKGTLQEQIDALNLKLKEFEDNQKTDLIQNAIDIGKIMATEKESFAKLDITNLKAVLKGIPDAPTSVMDIINKGKSNGENNLKDEYKAAFKKGTLAKIKSENPNHYKELFNAMYGKELK
jgi:ATP-dependent Clp protease protease subunit